jgi:hypothetical protein
MAGVSRRAFLVSGATFFAAPLGAEAQQIGRPYRIGTLSVSPVDRASHYIVAFEERRLESWDTSRVPTSRMSIGLPKGDWSGFRTWPGS